MQALESTLRQGLAELSLSLDASQIAALLAYLALLQKWSKVYNLTAVRDPAEMLTHHVLDSLAVIGPLRAQLAQLRPAAEDAAPPAGEGALRLLDVGSGAGLPGVVIAICCPELRVDCVDAVAKKVAFVQQVAASLRLPNLRGLHARVENLQDKYTVISARAFASLVDFTHWSSAALAQPGIWLAMKGKRPTEEMVALPASVQVFHVEHLQVPGLAAERCIVWLRQGGA